MRAWAGIFGIASMIGGEGGGLENLLANLTTFGALGFVGGTVFSGVLGIAERRRTFAEMSLRRFAAWGAAGGGLLMIPLFLGGMPVTLETVTIAGVLALLGAGCASGSLALARMADDRELLQAGESAGLIEGE